MTFAPGDRVAFGEGEVLWADDLNVLIRWTHQSELEVHSTAMIRCLPPLTAPPEPADPEGDDGSSFWTEALRQAGPEHTETLDAAAPGWRERLGLK